MRQFLLLLILLLPTWASAGQTLTTGTVFSEDFGNITTGGPCWSGGVDDAAKCAQMWVKTAGTNDPAIASAPTGWTGNALYLPVGAAAIKLGSYGSFPAVPAGTGFTFTATVNRSVYPAWGAPENILILRTTTGGGTESFVNALQSWQGRPQDGFQFPNGSLCAATVATPHTIKLVSNGTTISGFVDNVQCGAAWADPGYVVGDIDMIGSTVGDAYVQSVTLDGATVTGGFPPSVLIDFAGASGAVSAAEMNAGTHCGNAITGNTTVGNWAEDTTTGTSFTFEAGGNAFATPLTVCGSSYTGATNVVYKMVIPTGADTSGAWKTSFNSGYGSASIGFFWKFDSAGYQNMGVIDFAQLYYIPGHTYGLKFGSNPEGTVWNLCGENTYGGGSQVCIDYNLSQNTWYWVSFLITADGVDNRFGLYSSAGRELGTSAFDGTPQTQTPGIVGLRLGKAAEAVQNTANVYYSNIILDYADAAFPLLPPLAQPSGGIGSGAMGWWWFGR